jgi:hypothetical protein
MRMQLRIPLTLLTQVLCEKCFVFAVYEVPYSFIVEYVRRKATRVNEFNSFTLEKWFLEAGVDEVYAWDGDAGTDHITGKPWYEVLVKFRIGQTHHMHVFTLPYNDPEPKRHDEWDDNADNYVTL